jgi:glycosyltransferase involved in cell wall biosynthesis
MVAFTYYASDPRVKREAEALARRGDSVDVVCLRKPGAPATDGGVRVFGMWNARYSGGSPILYMLQYAGFLVAATATVTVLHLRRRYDLAHAHTMPDFMVFSAVVPKALGAKVILDVHDLSPELYESKFGLPKSHPLIRLLTWVERRSVAFADRAIAVHRPHLAALVGHGNPAEKFTVVLNAPDPEVFRPRSAARAPRRDRFQLVYHGTISPRHGLEIAVRAIASLRGEIEGLELLLIGDGDGLARVVDLVRELDVEDIVTVRPGFVPVADLPELLRDADVGVVPIYDDPFTRFMLPSKLLEYVAVGIPTICSSTDTIRAHFDDSMVRFVEPGDVDALAAAIRDLHLHPEKRLELARNADDFNVRFGWNSQQARYLELVDSLVAPVPRPRPGHSTRVRSIGRRSFRMPRPRLRSRGER